MKRVWVVLVALLLVGCADEESSDKPDAGKFLASYNEIDYQLYKLASQAAWRFATDINDAHTGERLGAEKALAAFRGSRYVIDASRRYLAHPQTLSDLEFRQLDKILLLAAESPGTIPAVVERRVEAEAHARVLLDHSPLCLERHGERCTKTISSQEAVEILLKSRDLAERRRVWEATKHTGATLKKPLAELRDLRNRVAAELGYSSYFHLQVADYGLSVPEMMQLMDRTHRDFAPLYRQLHLYARRKLAARYHQPVPKRMPAHWMPDRWGLRWAGLVESDNREDGLHGKSPEWIVQQAERMCTSLGFPALPAGFWAKSDLYVLPDDARRQKRARPATLHLDRDQDVRTLLNVTPTFRWFEIGHRELAHAHYDLAYAYPGVPHVLRDGANRAFHEAIAGLIEMASNQEPYLRALGLAPAHAADPMARLLDEALDNSVVQVPWSAGAMTQFEYEMYEKRLPAERWNQRWWELAGYYQGMEPPAQRGEAFCDACSRPQLTDHPAQSYDQALALLIRYQLHDYIARRILHQDPRQCSYYGNREVGRWLWNMMSLGATRAWRQVLREKTGEDLSSRAMVEYFRPLTAYLARENAGQAAGWE